MTKTCKNPTCRREYTPGHYGRRQQVCSRPECKAWYRVHWRQTRRPPRGLDPGTWDKAIKAAKPNLSLYSLLWCARASGLRKGELLGLAWGDVRKVDGGIRDVVAVRGQWRDGVGFKLSKTKADRLALFNTDACKALLSYWGTVGKGIGADDRVWPVSAAWAWGAWVKLQEQLGITNPETGQPYRFHDLRHTVGKELARAGRLDLVKKMLGHKRLETGLIYAEQAPEEVLADVEKIRRAARG